MEYRLLGYVADSATSVGILIPLFGVGEDYFFQELSDDNKTITGFSKINPEALSKRKSDLVNIKKGGIVKVGGESIVVVKDEEKILYGTYSSVVKQMHTWDSVGKQLVNSFKKIYNIDIASSVKYNLINTHRKRGKSLGKRSTTIRVSLSPGNGIIIINKQHYSNYFPLNNYQTIIEAPLKSVHLRNRIDVDVIVTGGTLARQAFAIQHEMAVQLSMISQKNRVLLEKDRLLTPSTKRVGRKKVSKRIVFRTAKNK